MGEEADPRIIDLESAVAARDFLEKKSIILVDIFFLGINIARSEGVCPNALTSLILISGTLHR